jgi:hypothetical protein
VTRAIRVGAWVVVLALAAYQAYASRYTVGPDGIAYLDLSDAVVRGRWSGLISLYWSPLYPVLIGLARLLFGTGAEREVPIVHVVNVAGLVATFATYEYFLSGVLRLARRVRGSPLGGVWARAACYALFTCVAFTLTPLELTTPDLFAAAAVFAAFGALLRIRDPLSSDSRAAVVLGMSLGVGGLAKSFLIPWAVVCIVVVVLATRRSRGTLTLAVVLPWLIILAPWVAALSNKAGRLTFGDAGRLTYAWYVNNQNAPSLGGVPSGARTAVTDSILPGTGVTGDAPGTDPMWFDPARWNASLRPHWDARDQLETTATLGRFYLENLAPLLFLTLLIAAAPAGSRRLAWKQTWVVIVPAVAGLAGYAVVLVTARYIMPFVLGGALVLLAALPLGRRIHPLAALLGVAVPILLEALDLRSAVALALVISIVGGLVAGVVVSTRRRVIWMVAVVLGMGITRVVLPASFPPILLPGGAALAAAIWLLSRRAIQTGHPVRFARRLEAALGVAIALLLIVRFGARLAQDARAVDRSASPVWGNLSWRIANDLTRHGIGPGTRIAVIGPHAESYWARTGRLTIVASVPGPVVRDFWRLAPSARDALLARFHAAGATVAIASVGPEVGAPDSSWTPVQFRGWIRPLGPASAR